VPVLYALAIVLAPGRRRRALMNVGLAAVLGGVLVLLGRSILRGQVVNSITSDASLRPTVEAVISISTAMINQIAVACIVVGVPLFLAGWFAGPARWARSSRHAIAPFLREHSAESYAITLGVMVLIFIWNPIHATGTPAGIIVLTLLALFGMFLLQRQTAEEFPDARLGDATQKMRARMQSARTRRADSKTPPASPQNTIPEQLQQLADLRDHGAISADEYQAAKAQLLHT
jgi:Short C-terminal domain